MSKFRGLLVSVGMTLFVFTTVLAEAPKSRWDYVQSYKHIAIKHMREYGIPASITMAQGILESGSGNSELALKSNNHFGIKCKSHWTGKTVRHDDDEAQECFRAYDTVEESYRDHADFLDSSPRYATLFTYAPHDYQRWARGLKAAGYATATHYADLLIKIIESEKLYLLDHDGGVELFSRRDSYELADFEGVVPTGSNTATVKSKTELAQNDVSQSAQPKRKTAKKTTPKVADVKAKKGIELVPSQSYLPSPTDVLDPDNFYVTIKTHEGYSIYRRNGIYYILVKDGNTLEGLGTIFGIWHQNLRRFNDKKRGEGVTGGDILYLETKATSWGGENATHVVKEGETLRSIAQFYGVRVSSLRRLNSLKRNTELLEIGSVVMLRKIVGDDFKTSK